MIVAAYLQSLISVVEVEDTAIRIKGSRDGFEKPVLATRKGDFAFAANARSTALLAFSVAIPASRFETVRPTVEAALVECREELLSRVTRSRDEGSVYGDSALEHFRF
ncbi:hypothetical protein PMN64_35300 [Bradyrhizobium sp. UFLA01-814]|uniref:hypothetical protein n=1 Tax=Bradyrhizobium sp. UFLA01-814 TaxID=3023480 RepID=UPI00398B2A30